MKQNRSTIKTYFETGDVPTQSQFGDSFDSQVFWNDDVVTTVNSSSTDDEVPTAKAVNDAIGAVPVPTLQEVTDAGSMTTNYIEVTDGIGAGASYRDGKIVVSSPSNVVTIAYPTPTGNGQIIIRDVGNATEYVAFLSDIPSTSTFVPYTGATGDVDLGSNKLNAQSVAAKGTGGNGKISIKHQSSTTSNSANESNISADSSGNPTWKNDGNAQESIFTSTLFGAIIAAFTAKTTPVDADLVGIADSAASNASKQVTLLTLWTNYIKTKADAVYTTTSAVATQITTALSGYATQAWVNSQGFITNVVTALGYTPANKAGDTFSGAISATNLSGTNTGDETNSSIISKIGYTPANVSQAANTMLANNTGSAGNMTAQTFRAQAKQTYSGTIVWTGTTAPSGATNHSYSWCQVGNLVTFELCLLYASAGSALTQVAMALPSDMPSPVKPDGITNTSDVIAMAMGQLSTTSALSASQGRAAVRIDSSSTSNFQFVVAQGSAAYKNAWITGSYLTT